MPGTGCSKTVERMLHDQGRIQILPGLDLFSALFSFSLVIRVPQIWSQNIFMASKNCHKNAHLVEQPDSISKKSPCHHSHGTIFAQSQV